MMNRIIATLFILSIFGGCEKPACDRADLKKIRDALGSVDSAMHQEMTANGLVDACNNAEKPMPASLKKALAGVYQAPPASRGMLILSSVADDISLWTKACATGAAALLEVSKASPEEKTRLLVSSCEFTKHAAFTSESNMLSAGPTDLILAALAYRYLLDDKVSEIEAQIIAKKLAGL